VFGATAALVNELDGFAYCPEDDVVLGSQELLAEAKTDLGRNLGVKLNEPWKN